MDWLSTEAKTLLVVIACLQVLKFILNLSKYLRTKWYHRQYQKWLSSSSAKFRESRGQVVKLLKEAGIKDSYATVAIPVGYERVSFKETSVLDNFPNSREDFAGPILAMFREAIGTYRARMLEALNPLYWIEFLIYLPREMLGYLGVPAESIVVKIGQLLWWVAATSITFLLAAYRPELRAFIESWFGQN